MQLFVERLQTLKSIDELKAAQEEIIERMDKIFESAVEGASDFADNMFSLTPQERESMSNSFQDGSFLLDPEIEKETARFTAMPDSAEYMEAFGQEMEKRLTPHMEKYGEQMTRILKAVMEKLGTDIPADMDAEGDDK